MTRIMTYNVHRCVGVDGVLDIGRVAAVIARERPDIVALQELDVGRARTGGVDQAEAIAAALGMHVHFHAAFNIAEERYGDAILCTAPITVRHAGALPSSLTVKGLEPRGALWVTVELEDCSVQVVNTHLGLVPHEQRAQADALMTREWLGHPDCTDPAILVGDFNATAQHSTYRRIAARLEDAQAAVRRQGRRLRTFPSRMPMLRIDHVFVSRSVKVTAASAPRHALARLASDHLPLVVDFRIDKRGWASEAAAVAEAPELAAAS
jgi:endonuclease/exonuclease/phosphatase family metal-dependent hydrolase